MAPPVLKQGHTTPKF